MTGRSVLFSCKSYPKSPVVLQSKRMNTWHLEHAWKFQAERTSMRLWLCVQAGSEWWIMSVKHLLIPRSHKYNVCHSGWTLLGTLSKKAGCGLWPCVSSWFGKQASFLLTLHALYRSHRFHLSLQHSLDQPHEHCRYRALTETSRNAMTRWLKKFELMSVLCCQKYKFSLSCASTSDVFGLYLISASFPGVLNTKKKSWCILFEQVWLSLSYRQKAIYSVLFSVIISL